MHNKLLTAAIFSLLLTTATPACAETAATPSTDPSQSTQQTDIGTKPESDSTFSLSHYKIGEIINVKEVPALRNVLTDGETLRYMGDEYGVSAIFITRGDMAQIVYVTPDGQGILNGPLFEGGGGSVTLRQISRLKNEGSFDPTPYLDRTQAAFEKQTSGAGSSSNNTAAERAQNIRPEPKVANPNSPGERLFREANAASWIAFGPSSAPMVTTFMDPGCEHCHTFFNKLKPLTEQGKLYLRVLPVTTIDPSGKSTLINVFSSPSPAKAWSMLAEGLTPPLVGSLDQRASNAVINNNNIFTRWKLTGTPYSIYRDKTGEVKILYSTPEDMSTLLDDLGVSN